MEVDKSGAQIAADKAKNSGSAKDRVKQAIHNPAFLPIPEYVMNDAVRNFEPPREAYHMDLKYGW